MTNFEKVREFHKAFGVEEHISVDDIVYTIRNLRIKLMKEELEESLEAMYEEDGPQIAKELCDLLYVVYGTLAVYGIDADAAFSAVHESNMSKLGLDGKPVYRHDGKVIKGPNYKKPDMSKYVK